MKERIKELYNQSLIRETVKDSNGNPMLAIKQNPEKFAELIVQECSRQILSTILLEGDDGSVAEVLMHASFQLKQHFGVEL
jgi:hypothetical protein